VNILGEELPTRWKSGMTALANSTSRAAGHSLQMITTSSEVSSCPLTFILAHRSLT
jgi:hypothetical protein